VYGHIITSPFSRLCHLTLVRPGPWSVKPLLALRCVRSQVAWNKKAAGGKADMGDLPWKNGGFHRFYMVLLRFLWVLWWYHGILITTIANGMIFHRNGDLTKHVGVFMGLEYVRMGYTINNMIWRLSPFPPRVIVFFVGPQWHLPIDHIETIEYGTREV
jgi:hypothetical protein